jgi:bacteriocin-like protein
MKKSSEKLPTLDAKQLQQVTGGSGHKPGTGRVETFEITFDPISETIDGAGGK